MSEEVEASLNAYNNSNDRYLYQYASRNSILNAFQLRGELIAVSRTLKSAVEVLRSDIIVVETEIFDLSFSFTDSTRSSFRTHLIYYYLN